MIDDVLSLHKLHVVDFSSRLHPFESELVRELHASRHVLVAALDQRIFRQLRVITQADETISR